MLIDRMLSYTADLQATYANIGWNLAFASVDEDVKEAQTLNTNKNYGTNPTHTQIAKDALNHPLNPLASELAKVAIKDVGMRIREVWKSGVDPTGKEFADYVINKYTVHPSNPKSDWADKIVFDWATIHKNAILRSQSDSVYDHAEKVTQRGISNEKVQEILKHFNK